MKPSIFIFTMILMSLVVPGGCLKAQWVYQKPTTNPFSHLILGLSPAPALTDIDGDGDVDLFIGQYNSNEMLFYRNTGTKQAPKFESQTGINNPLDNYTSNSGCNSPVLVDIDGDLDLDAFVGIWTYLIRYHRNEGTPTNPKFVVQDGGNNPLHEVYTKGICSYPAFVDMDGDQDLDAFVTDGDGNIEFYKNTGIKTSPVYLKDSLHNPLRMVDLTARATIVFQDVDGDGLKDAVIGHDLSKPEVLFLKNTGTPNQTVFEIKTGVNNPFREITGTGTLIPVFADLDGDGDGDLIIGTDNNIQLYEAKAGSTTSTLSQENSTTTCFPNPTAGKLTVSGTGLLQIQVLNIQGQVILTIKPALEKNSFELDHQKDGLFFLKITTLQGTLLKKVIKHP